MKTGAHKIILCCALLLILDPLSFVAGHGGGGGGRRREENEVEIKVLTMPEGAIEKAVALDHDGHTDEAIEYLEKIGEGWLMNYQAFLLLGKFHLKASNYSKAQTYFEKGKSFMPYDECPVDIILGMIYEANGNHIKAIESWNSCLLYAFRDRAIIEMATKHLERLKEKTRNDNKRAQRQTTPPLDIKESAESIDLKTQRIFKSLLQNHESVKLLENENHSSPSFSVKPSDYMLTVSSIGLINVEHVLFKKNGPDPLGSNEANISLETLSVSFSSVTIAVKFFEANSTKMICEGACAYESVDIDHAIQEIARHLISLLPLQTRSLNPVDRR